MRTQQSPVRSLIAITCALAFVTGCKAASPSADVAQSQIHEHSPSPPNDGKPIINHNPHVARTISHIRKGLAKVIDVRVTDKSSVELNVKSAPHDATGEQIVDLDSPTGLSNFIAATCPHESIHRVILHNGQNEVVVQLYINGQTAVSQSVDASSATFALGQHIQVPPPGTTLDHTLTPLAAPGASVEAKTEAVERVASSLEGSPYIWGQNPDLGQSGVDCANFIAYVYHHALGYQMSTSSRIQWDTVGISVPLWDLRPGDLLIFEHGRHVGIYTGNDEMIQAGGGLNKVGSIALGPESYWGKRLSAVRRMY